jgi:ketosteroid isomerase-like protein
MSAQLAVEAYWAAAEARDWEAFGRLLADDVVYEGLRPENESAAETHTFGSTSKAFVVHGTSRSSRSLAGPTAPRTGSSSLVRKDRNLGCASSGSTRLA